MEGCVSEANRFLTSTRDKLLHFVGAVGFPFRMTASVSGPTNESRADCDVNLGDGVM